jgi:hypothetical protein
MYIRYPEFLDICVHFKDDFCILLFIEHLACGNKYSQEYLQYLQKDESEFIKMLKQLKYDIPITKKNNKTIREEMIDNYYALCIDKKKLTVKQGQKQLMKTYALFQNKIFTSKNFNIVNDEIDSIEF